jgi:hypothetical protein
MKKNKVVLWVVFTTFIGLLFFIVSPAFCWQSKDPQLAEDFAKMIGFKTKDKVGKVSPEIKPGMVIDVNNVKQYPGIMKLLPVSLQQRLDPNAYAPLAPIKIKETDQYHMGRGWIDLSYESAKTTKFGADGITLEGYKGGYPFLHPTEGRQLIWNMLNEYLGDRCAFRPMRLRLYNKANKPEREIRQHLNRITMAYATDLAYYKSKNPEYVFDPKNPEGILYAVTGTFTYPKDVSGTSYVRKRFIDGEHLDEFLLYIPSMRRVRRMSGADSQDPLFGSDLTWDDYNMYWKKPSVKSWPDKYTMLAPGVEFLVPTVIDYDWPQDRAQAGYTDYGVDEATDQTWCRYGTWQRRWLWPLQIDALDPAYCYSKRLLYVEMEHLDAMECEMYDQAGRLWRDWYRDYNLSQTGVGMMEELIDITDHINNHRTILDFKGERTPTWMGTDFMDIRFLSKKAK